MKESYSEDLASHTGLELYAGDGNVMGVATTEVHAGELLSSEITLFVRRPCLCSEKTTRSVAYWRGTEWHGGVAEPQHAWKLQAREPGDPIGFRWARVGSELAPWNGQRTSPTVMLI